MKVIILGCGRIGMQCAEVLHAAGHQVVGVKRQSSAVRGDTDAIEMLYGDASDEGFVQQCAAQHPVCAVVLVCANPGFRAEGSPVGNGVEAMLRHVRALYPQSRVVYTSSTYVYGDAAGGLVDEGHALATDQRAQQLWALEQQVLSCGAAGLVLRLSALHSDQRSFLRDRIRRCESVLKIRGPQQRVFNYCHDDDAVAVICAAVDGTLCDATGAQMSGILNVTAPDRISCAAYYQQLIADAGRTLELDLQEESCDQADRQVDAARLYAALPAHVWTLFACDE